MIITYSWASFYRQVLRVVYVKTGVSSWNVEKGLSGTCSSSHWVQFQLRALLKSLNSSWLMQLQRLCELEGFYFAILGSLSSWHCACNQTNSAGYTWACRFSSWLICFYFWQGKFKSSCLRTLPTFSMWPILHKNISFKKSFCFCRCPEEALHWPNSDFDSSKASCSFSFYI